MARYNWIALVFLCLLGSAWAINIELGTRALVQPDGTRFSVREYADEFGHYLAAERGFVVKDETTGYYYYARYDSNGHATPSALRVGRDDASSDVVRLAEENYQALKQMAWRFRGGGSLAGAAGTRGAMTFPESLLVILVEFSDVKHQNNDDWPMEGLTGGDKDDGDANTEDYPEYRVSDFEAMLFGDNYTHSPDDEMAFGSMRQYYEDMSRGTYTLKGKVVNQVREDDSDIPIWVTLGNTKSYYHRPDGNIPTGEKDSEAKRSFRDAVMAAAASQQGIDTTTSATRKLCIIYAGNKYSSGGLHPHYWANRYIMSERTASSSGVEINDAEFSPIGTHCHEFGHVLGLADYYHERNYRVWGLMANGGHKGGGANPSPLSPHLRSLLGWLTPTEVTGFMENETLSYSSDQDDVYRIRSSSDQNDFFLIENRQADESWNKGLEDGLLIWHIKDFPDVPEAEEDWVDLIEADNRPNGPDAGDPFPGSTGNRNLTDFTSPSSRRFANPFYPDLRYNFTFIRGRTTMRNSLLLTPFDRRII